jgi:type IV secretory pathway TrbD component
MIKHPFHLVDYSPWPLVGACRALSIVGGMAAWIHGFDTLLFKIGIAGLLITIIQW